MRAVVCVLSGVLAAVLAACGAGGDGNEAGRRSAAAVVSALPARGVAVGSPVWCAPGSRGAPEDPSVVVLALHDESLPGPQDPRRIADGAVAEIFPTQTDLKLREQQSQADNLDSIEALRAWCEGAAQRLESVDCVGGCEIGSLTSELAETDLSVRADLVKAFDRWEAPIRSGLGRMQEMGELDSGADVDRLATALLAAIEGGMLLAQIHRSATPYRHAVAVVIDQIESCTPGRR